MDDKTLNKAINWHSWIEDLTHEAQLKWVTASMDQYEQSKGFYSSFLEVKSIFETGVKIDKKFLNLIGNLLHHSSALLCELEYNFKAPKLTYFNGRLMGFKEIEEKLKNKLTNKDK